MKSKEEIKHHISVIEEELKRLLNTMYGKLLLEEKAFIMIKVIIAQAEQEQLEWVLK